MGDIKSPLHVRSANFSDDPRILHSYVIIMQEFCNEGDIGGTYRDTLVSILCNHQVAAHQLKLSWRVHVAAIYVYVKCGILRLRASLLCRIRCNFHLAHDHNIRRRVPGYII